MLKASSRTTLLGGLAAELTEAAAQIWEGEASLALRRAYQLTLTCSLVDDRYHERS